MKRHRYGYRLFVTEAFRLVCHLHRIGGNQLGVTAPLHLLLLQKTENFVARCETGDIAAHLQPGQTGQTVLIHAAAGGVGSMAVQLAHQAGVTVLATASANNHDYVRALGADQVVDYHDEDFAAQFEFTGKRAVDLVLAPFAGRSLQGSAELVDANTRIVLLSPVATEADMKIGPVESQVMIVQADGAALEKVAERFVSGELQAEIAQVFPFAQIKQAHQLSETEHARGKIVLKITE